LFFEAFLHKHKLTYVRNMDLSTLDNRVIRVVQMTLAPRKFVFSQMPKIIVEINLDKEECNWDKVNLLKIKSVSYGKNWYVATVGQALRVENCSRKYVVKITVLTIDRVRWNVLWIPR
jgi:hypothetical protein